MMTKISVSIPEEILEQTQIKAKKSGATVSGVIRVRLEEWLDGNQSLKEND